MGDVVNSIVVDFTNVSDGAKDEATTLILEVDRRSTSDGGMNARSNPLYSEPCFLLLYENQVINTSVACSAGQVSMSLTERLREVTEYVTFGNTVQQASQYPIASVKSVRWLGNDLGAVTVSKNKLLQIESAGIGVLELVYQTKYRVVQLTAPTEIPEDLDEYQVLVVVTGEEQLGSA